MSKALGSTYPFSGTSAHVPSLQWLRVLRLVVGLGIVLGAIISLTGTSWDIQWHSFVGRDRTLIPPHIMMLTGISFAGLLTLASVVFETVWTRRNPQLARYSTDFAGLFSCSLGAYVAGFGALSAAIAFPLDSYWHALYGIDVSIWAPFHIMILTGMAMMPLGAAYLLTSSAGLARMTNKLGGVRIGYVGTILALGAMMGIFTLMLPDALDEGNSIQLGTGFINFFPLLASMVVGFTFVTARYALPYRASATYIAFAYIAFALLFSVFVPPATGALVVSEGLHYRRELGQFAYLSIVAARYWPLMPIVIAPLIDICFSWMRHHSRNGLSLTIVLTLLALLSFFPVFALSPTFGLRYVVALGPVGLTLSLLIGCVGAYVATILGCFAGVAMNQKEE